MQSNPVPSQPSKRKRWRFMNSMFPPSYPRQSSSSSTTTTTTSTTNTSSSNATTSTSTSTILKDKNSRLNKPMTRYHHRSLMYLLRVLFYHFLSKNQFQMAVCVLSQSALVSTSLSKAEHAHENTGGLLGETTPLKEMFVALYRKGAIDAQMLENFFISTYHQDNRHPTIYLDLLMEWGKTNDAIRLFHEGPRHFNRQNLKFYEQEIAFMKFVELDNFYLNYGEMYPDKLLYAYEMIKPVDFVSAWHRAKSLVLFGQVGLAERVFEGYCEDHPEDSVALQHLIEFKRHRKQIMASVRPTYVPEIESIDVEREIGIYKGIKTRGFQDPFLSDDEDDVDMESADDEGAIKVASMENVTDRLLDLDPVNPSALEVIVATEERSWQAFTRLWDAIQVYDYDDYWVAMVEIAAEDYADHRFASHVQQHCAQFLSFMPIHMPVFQQLRDLEHLDQIPHRQLLMLTHRAIIFMIVLDQVEDRMMRMLVGSALMALDEPKPAPINVLFKLIVSD